MAPLFDIPFQLNFQCFNLMYLESTLCFNIDQTILPKIILVNLRADSTAVM